MKADTVMVPVTVALPQRKAVRAARRLPVRLRGLFEYPTLDLTPAEARDLAADLIRMADEAEQACDHSGWPLILVEGRPGMVECQNCHHTFRDR